MIIISVKSDNMNKVYKLFMISASWFIGIGQFFLIFVKLSRNESVKSAIISGIYSLVALIYATTKTREYINEQKEKL